jgi:hypothetical protein
MPLQSSSTRLELIGQRLQVAADLSLEGLGMLANASRPLMQGARVMIAGATLFAIAHLLQTV